MANHTANHFVELDWAGRPVKIEYRWCGEASAKAPLVIFLHEGLGSIALWRDFPQRLCAAVGARGLVYSRPGYGNSTPRPSEEKWQPDYLHRQAEEVLPQLLHALALDDRPYWLFGHSD